MTDNIIIQSTSHYIKESLYVFILDIVIVFIIMSIFFIPISNPIPVKQLMIFVFIIGMCYFLLQFVFNYRLGILAFIDRNKKDYKSKVISIKGIKIESLWSGWLVKSVTTGLYPKELEVERYKIIYTDVTGNKGIMRLVMSRNQSMNIDDLFKRKYKINKIKAIYCKRSKVLLRLVMIDNVINDFTNKEKSKIDHTLNRINRRL